MPYAVTLRLDPAAAARVERIWHALADLTGEDDAPRLGYPPHLTLAVLPDTAPAPSVEAAVSRMAAAWDALPVTLAGLAVFPGTPPVLWAAPVPSDDLLARHGMLHAALAPLPVHPHYRPGGWVPHVTLAAAGRSPAARMLDAALSAWEGPIEGRLGRIEFVRFRPVVVLRGEDLPPATTGDGSAGS
jgi:2'-5' RNA ligase